MVEGVLCMHNVSRAEDLILLLQGPTQNSKPKHPAAACRNADPMIWCHQLDSLTEDARGWTED